jgi:hypothetical protein
VKQVITFSEKTSSPELKNLIQEFNQRIVMPTYLPPEQQKKIYREKFKVELENDPITIEIDGVVHKFRYVDRFTLPHVKKLVTDILRLMKEPQDFLNLPPLLEGCKRAHRKLPDHFHLKMVRMAAQAKMLPVILDMFLQADKTGFLLDNSELLNEVLVWIQNVAIESGWQKAEIKRALERVKLIINEIEADELHHPTDAKRCLRMFHRDPQVLAARLHMAAALAVHHRGSKDVDGKVTKWAEEIVELWPENTGLLNMQPEENYLDDNKLKYLLLPNQFLFYASPILSGLVMATQVVEDPALQMQLQNRADAVEAEIRLALQKMEEEGKTGRGLTMYNKLFARDESEEGAKDESEW